MALSTLILNRSNEALNPGSQSGCDNTIPTSVLRAISGVNAVLPTRICRIGTVVPLLLTKPLVVVGAANNSLKLGARASREVTARIFKPETGNCHVAPAFHVVVLPAVL